VGKLAAVLDGGRVDWGWRWRGGCGVDALGRGPDEAAAPLLLFRWLNAMAGHGGARTVAG